MVLIPVCCLYCQSDQGTKRGKTKAGKQRYRCHNLGTPISRSCLIPPTKGAYPRPNSNLLT
jgi:hypothetical protein